MSSYIIDHTNNKKLCEAIDCNLLASTEIEFEVKNKTVMKFQVCNNCKKKFFMNKGSVRDE